MGLRIGVLGAGWFASRRHLPDIVRNKDAVLAAICRRDGSALKRLSDQFHPEGEYTDWRQMLDGSRLDGVVIATPPHLHFEQAKAALSLGIHVLLEKPMTITANDAHELARIASAAGLTLSVAVNPPFWAHCHRIRAAILDGLIGDIEAANMFWTGNADYVFGRAPKPADLPGTVPPTLFRADPDQGGGGYFIDGGTHLVSDLLFSTGLRATRVYCQMDALPIDTRVSLSITLENGAAANITCVGDSRLGSRRVRNVIAGSKGTVSVEGFDFRTTIERIEGNTEYFTENDLPRVPGPVDNLVDVILGRSEPVSTPEHGVHVVEVVEAAYVSAKMGCAVTIP